MKILRKEGKGNKDYYDWVVSKYGEDPLVVYDRRNAFPIDPTKKWGECVPSSYSSQNPNFNLYVKK